MVKPAEQWSIRTRAERAIESGLDGALTQVIAKLPRRLVAELTGQPAGQRIADPPAWASSSALGPVHAPTLRLFVAEDGVQLINELRQVHGDSVVETLPLDFVIAVRE